MNGTRGEGIIKKIAGLGIRSFQKNATFLRNKRTEHFWRSFPFFIKEQNVFVFFSVLYKRTERSLRSFLFFIKERSVLSVLYKRTFRSFRSFPFCIKERNVLFTFFS